MKAEHEPDDAFVENLEWQLTTALRRRERFAEPASRHLRSLAQTAGLVLLSLTVGAAGAVAAGKLQDDERTELLLRQNGIQLELAERRVDGAATTVDTAQVRYEQGIAPQTEVLQAGLRLLEEKFLLDRLALDRAEMTMSGARAAHVFSAQLVAGRDFVTERLVLELEYERSRLKIHDQRLELALQRFQAGIQGPGASDEFQASTLESRGRIEALEEQILLRSLFLAGELTPEEVELRNLRLEVQVRQRFLRTRRDSLAGEVLRTRMLVEQGAVPDSQLRDLDLELDALEADILLLELEARILDKELGIELPPPTQESPQVSPEEEQRRRDLEAEEKARSQKEELKKMGYRR